MLTAFVTQVNGRNVSVHLASDESTTTTTVADSGENTTENSETTVAETKSPPNPIAPEGKELYWGAGSFLVLLVLMRFVFFPKVKRGMEARYEGVRQDIEGADAVKSSARADVAAYDKALAEARNDAAKRVDAARATLDSERQKALAEVNARIATRRGEADQQASAAREAARGQIATAVGAVASKAAEIAIGRKPDAAVVDQAVKSVMESAGTR